MSIKLAAPDEMLEYATAVLNDGLLMLELHDAVHEADGDRRRRCWKLMAQHHNYAIEVFNFLALVGGVASPSVAHQLKWSSFVNRTGKPGHNIPADLEMEHLNRFLKSYITGLGANVSETSIVQVSRALDGLKNLCDNFDSSLGLHPESTHHTRKSSSKDEELILSELKKATPFLYTPGQTLKCTVGLKSNIASQINPKEFISWLKIQKKKMSDLMNFKTLFK